MRTQNTLTARDRMERAFFDLLEEYPYGKISVAQLIQNAGVSRTTFYRHYTDIFDMYKKVCEHMLDELLKLPAPIASEPQESIALDIFDKFSTTLQQQQKYILLLSGTNGDRYFFELLLQKVLAELDDSPLPLTETEKFKIKFVTFAGVCTYVGSLFMHLPLTPQIITLGREIMNTAPLFEDKKND